MTKNFKITILLLCAFASGTFYSSCFDSNESETVVSDYSNALVTSFSLGANSNVCSNLSGYMFSIDQLGVTDPDLIEHTANLWKKDQYSMLPGIIFNADSLPIGTIADSIEVSMSYSSPKEVKVFQYDQELNLLNTVNYLDTSVVSFDDYAYTRFEVTAYDGATNKSYFVKMNVHCVTSDTLVWKYYTPLAFETASVTDQRVDTIGDMLYWYTQLANGTQQVRKASFKGNITNWSEPTAVNSPANINLWTLYGWNKQLYGVAENGALLSTTDGTNWSEISNSFYFVNLLGVQLASRKHADHLCAIVLANGSYNFASSEDGATWELDLLNNGSAMLPTDFPIKGYTRPISTPAHIAMGNTTSRIYIVGGETADGTLSNSTWSSDGNTWVEFPQNTLPAMKGASVISYTRDTDKPNSFWIMQPGQMAGGAVSNTLWFTENSGITWKKLSSEYSEMADTYKIAPIGCNSAFVNPSTYAIYFLGGIDADGKQQSSIFGGVYTNLQFWKYR